MVSSYCQETRGRKSAVLRNESFVRMYEFRNQVDEGAGLEGWKSDSRSGAVESCHVLVWPEEAHLACGVLVGFHTLEALEGVVEDAGRGIEAEVLVWRYAWGEPALGGRPFYGEHVVYFGADVSGVGG